MRGPDQKEIQSKRLFIARSLAAMLFVVVAIAAILLRLYWLQIQHHDHFKTLATDNRIKLLPLPPARGEIFDRNGVVLAQNMTSVDLFITPDQVEDIPAVIAELQHIIPITEDDIQRFEKLKRRVRRFEQVPIRTGLTDEEMAQFAVERHRFRGVDLGVNLRRYYPHGELTAHVIGYIGRINEREVERIDKAAYAGTSHIGKTGLERFYEEQLHGDVGVQRVEIDAAGHIIRILETQPPSMGEDIQLHFDIELQKVAFEALGEHSGSVVAIDVKSGGVLAMASKPSFDANLFVNGISFKDYNALRDDSGNPLFNRAINGSYPPGSTVKPFIGLAGLETGTVNHRQTIYCPGHYKIKNAGRTFRDWKRSGHGTIDLEKSIEQSCDVYYYDLAYSMGIEKMQEYLSGFHFGKRTGIDMPAETRAILPSQAWKKKRYKQSWLPGDTVNAGIGQGYFLVSPVQLAYATAVLAADGKLIQPRLAARIGNLSTLSEETALESIEKRDPIHWKQVIDGMLAVTEGKRGTAKRIRNDYYRIAGKTGTAQVVSMKQNEEYDETKLSKEKHDHALFMAFAPAEDPQIAVAVIAENGGHGGATAAPIARKVMDAWFGIQPAKPAQTLAQEVTDE
ncbi:MAG: penicillin-binding protein 2 [Chromatiales bacterium]|jgi:penicillin-binding protein 2